ncbi:MAG: class I SAM-dependent methyltransferase [Chloroflexota bacterium]|nr:class I SAM-dependent methyltransferase [Chloroflexota bacterium]
MRLLRSIGIFILLVVGVSLWWRRASRRRSLPCPTWLASGLESPVMDRVLGTRTTLDRIDLQPGQRGLEVGPGPGRLLIPAAKRVSPGGEVIGLDIQPGMVERLKARAAQAGVANLTAVEGDATQPHFPPGHFDVIWMCTVLGEIPDREAALRQCSTALKPGGRLSITEIFPDPHYQSDATVRRLAEGAGFSFREVQGPWYFFTANFVKSDGSPR